MSETWIHNRHGYTIGFPYKKQTKITHTEREDTIAHNIDAAKKKAVNQTQATWVKARNPNHRPNGIFTFKHENYVLPPTQKFNTMKLQLWSSLLKSQPLKSSTQITGVRFHWLNCSY